MPQLMLPRPSYPVPPRQFVLSPAFLAAARSSTFGDHLQEGEPDPNEEVLARVGDWMPDTLVADRPVVRPR